MPVEETLRDEILLAVYRHWAERRRGRSLPSRDDIDPLAIPAKCWPHTILIEVVPSAGGPRFRYRRAGQVFWSTLGRDPTGKFADEVLPEIGGYRDYILDIFREVAKTGIPLYSETTFVLRGQTAGMLTKRVTLPLSRDGATVDMILGGHVFDSGGLSQDYALPLIQDVRQGVRMVIAE